MGQPSETDACDGRRATLTLCLKNLLARAAENLRRSAEFVADALAEDSSAARDEGVTCIAEFLDRSAPSQDMSKYLRDSALYTLCAAEQVRRLVPGAYPPIHEDLAWWVSQWEAGATQTPAFFGMELPGDLFNSVESSGAHLLTAVPDRGAVEECARHLVSWGTVYLKRYYGTEDQRESDEWMHMYLTYHELADLLRERSVDGRAQEV